LCVEYKVYKFRIFFSDFEASYPLKNCEEQAIEIPINPPNDNFFKGGAGGAKNQNWIAT